MTIEDSEITDLDFIIKVQELGDHLIGVLLTVAVADVSNHSLIETLHCELQVSDSESCPWLQIPVLVLEESLINPTRLICTKVEVSEHDSPRNLVIVDFEVRTAYLFSLQLHVILRFLQTICLSEDKR